MSVHAVMLTSYNTKSIQHCARASQVGNDKLYPDVKQSEVPGPPPVMMPRISTVLFPEDKLPRPAVIDVMGSYASYTDSATAIKEILSSVLNLPSSIKSTVNKPLQGRDMEDSYTSANNEESDDEHEDIPLMPATQNDIRFNRHRAAWDNSQMDSPDTPPLDLLAPLRSTPGGPLLESSHYLKCNDCSKVILPGSEFVSPLNLHVKLATENRRFSSPSIGPHDLNPDQYSLHLEQFTFNLNETATDTEASTEEDKKSCHRRSASCSNIFKGPGSSPPSSTRPLLHPAENLFEATVNLEKENEHFLVADLFISLVEMMKSSCPYEQWRPEGRVQWLKKDPEETASRRHKANSESAISTDSGYEGLAAVQNSPAETIFEEEEYIRSPTYKCTTIYKYSPPPEVIEDDDDYDEDDYDYVVIEMEEFDEETTKEEPDHPTEGTDPVITNSAEQTAMNLYRAFRQQWICADEDVQLPARLTIDALSCKHTIPEELESSGSLVEEIKLVKIRDAEDWSPPRFQIINTVHPYVKRDEVVASQNYLCVGCGTKLEPRYTNRLRYCDYLGKYFCDCCHHYSESPIPGRILSKWNFSKYYVSNFSKNIVDVIWGSHMFNVQSENPALYKKVRDLERIKEVQQQLIHIRKLVMTCRFADCVIKAFEEVPSHLTRALDLFTLEDLHKVKQKTLLQGLRELLALAVAHVEECPLCQGKGFICEFCRHSNVIFPFQTEIVRRCEACKACYHKECFKTEDCPKCLRIKARQARMNDSPFTSSGEVDPSATA